MFFKSQRKWIALLCCLLPYCYLQQSIAAGASLQVKPNKCVALNQGRECFANVSITWRSEHADEYCLYIKYLDGKSVKIKCWQQVSEGQLRYEFQSTNNAQMLLMRSVDNQMLASATIEVSWLYKASSRKRRWRLF